MVMQEVSPDSSDGDGEVEVVDCVAINARRAERAGPSCRRRPSWQDEYSQSLKKMRTSCQRFRHFVGELERREAQWERLKSPLTAPPSKFSPCNQVVSIEAFGDYVYSGGLSSSSDPWAERLSRMTTMDWLVLEKQWVHKAMMWLTPAETFGPQSEVSWTSGNIICSETPFLG